MSEIIGRQIEFGVATEATRGTPETAADKWSKKVSANVVERASHVLDDATRGRLEDMDGRRVAQTFIEGEVAGIVHADVIGYLFANLYGAVVSSNVSGSVYSHVFNLNQEITHQSLSLFAKDGSVQQLVYDNAMINSLQITVAQNDFVRFTASFLAVAGADNADTPSYDTEYDFIARDVTVKIADSQAGLSGAAATKAKDVSISFDQGLIRDHVVGSYTPDDIYNGHMMIEGSMTLNFDSETLKDLYLADTAKYMSITITGEADLGGGNNPEIEIILNKAQFMEWNRSGDASDLVTQEVTFRAFYNPTDSKQSQVTVQNLTSAYDNVPSN